MTLANLAPATAQDTAAGLVLQALPPPTPRTALLKDGRSVLLLPFDASVHAGVPDQVMDGMSPYSRWMRYHAGVNRLTAYMRRRLVDEVDGTLHAAWVVMTSDGTPLGLARVVRSSATAATAELALEVVDSVRGLGAGRELLFAAAEGAYAVGVDLLVGEVLEDNAAALALVRRTGAVRVASHRGVVSFQLSTGESLRPPA